MVPSDRDAQQRGRSLEGQRIHAKVMEGAVGKANDPQPALSVGKTAL
jgi:hypothetical protein